MKIIRNDFIPFEGFKLMNLFGTIFVRGDSLINDYDINHEAIHTAQMKELGYIPFYIIYLIEWLYRVTVSEDKFSNLAYRNISFEREAYEHEKDLDYLNKREKFNWICYL